MTTAYPLQWPDGLARTSARSVSKFKVTPVKAYGELIDELRLFQVQDIVVSSNIPLRTDGTPYRDGLTDQLSDPGVAVYFTRKRQQICVPCDTYRRPWENIRAIGLAVNAFRALERHGATQILDQAFNGFIALPAPRSATTVEDWARILEVAPDDCTLADVDAAYKRLAKQVHPDKPSGSQQKFQKLHDAYEQAKAILGDRS